MKYKHLIIFGAACVIAWAIATLALAYVWPYLVNNSYRKAILDQGFGNGPVPVNTLYTEPQDLFAEPLNIVLPPGSSNLMTRGVNHDTLLSVGVLDLSKGPLVLQVPAMPGRYYSVQFTDPSDGTDFAYVGTRATGSSADKYLITGPAWSGTVPQGMTRIPSPDNSVLVIGRVFVESNADLPTAYALAAQIELTPLQ